MVHQYIQRPILFLQRGRSQVLRRSLQEAQKRCEALNGDMLRQTEANDELMATLNTVPRAFESAREIRSQKRRRICRTLWDRELWLGLR